jgi:hypothetical protein
MTEDCPGFDRERRICLLRPDDCEFAARGVEATPTPQPPEPTEPAAPVTTA